MPHRKELGGRLAPVVVLAFLVILLGISLVPRVSSQLIANGERVQMLRQQDLSGQPEAVDELAWDAGWRSLCSPGGTTTPVVIPDSERAASFSALVSIDRGDYAAAKTVLEGLLEQGQVDEIPNGPAYLAALTMDWVEAVRLYRPQPTARHQRWWGTIHYLAAQRLMFEGKAGEAAGFYRQADEAYGTLGPYLGLGLVECFVRAERPMEAWDAYRRALVVMPVEEALADLSRFNELRLAGLRVWHETEPDNARVAHWLDLYEKEALSEVSPAEMVDAEPVPVVSLALPLAEGRVLLGFDYRVEDIETGPFMDVDFYVRDGEGETARYRRLRRTVLNQAPNGAFAWDSAPDGVRPVGWHGLVYSPDLAALVRQELPPGDPWLCLDAGRIGTSFGLQSNAVPLPSEPVLYLQGGQMYPFGDASLSLGRTWFGLPEPYNYSYVGGGRQPDQSQVVVGGWELPEGADGVAVWLLSHQSSKGCFRNLYLFTMGDS